LTSNRTRELHEALRRRCVYHWIDYPSPEQEARIVMLRAAGVAERTAKAVARAVARLRQEPLVKPPGIAEAVEWAQAVDLLIAGGTPWPEAFRRSLGVVIKDEEDLPYVKERLDSLLAEARP
jgi:MoxR-like ATPase